MRAIAKTTNDSKGHDPGSEKCEQYEEENIVSFHGHKNVLSNFYPVDVNVNGKI